MSSNPNIKIDVSTLKIGEVYFRKKLAELWHYKGEEALHKGIVHPKDSNIIILFTTEEKDKYSTQYEDKYSNGKLKIDGQNAHGTDDVIQNHAVKIYSFYRKKKKDSKNQSVPFVYQGEAVLIKEESIIRPKGDDHSKFCFKILADCSDDKIDSEIDNALVLEMTNMSEGAQKLVQHILYERNPKVRAEALKFHPHHCTVCGFDFDAFYGEECAEGYIEIHHINPVSEGGVREVNPVTDLAPICANCHRMIHHRRNRTMSLDELRGKIKR